ncbi:MAG: hypothetical protein HY252_05675 [Sphingobacteriales bacterium]|nr:hypothetical protein [Sphingobacteriales bacterium]
MEKVVNIQPLHSKKNDFHFWKDKPDAEKLAAIEMLRQQYIHFKFNNVQPRFQRVCRVINKAQG